MKVQNGIEVYDQNEQPPIPEGLSVDFQVFSPYGFKIIEVEGKKMWTVATEEDYKTTEAQRRGISPSEVDSKDGNLAYSCYNQSPIACGGWCAAGQFCHQVYNPNSGGYYCTCT